jgi:PAS domain-containing protein
MSEGIIEIMAQGDIIYANPTALGIVEIPEERLLALDVLELFDEIDRIKVDKLIKSSEKAILGTNGSTAGGIAHDFNNLLMGIQGYTSLILFDMNTNHPHYEKLKRIEDHVRSGAELTK